MNRKLLPALLAASMVLVLSSCTVMRSTYDRQVDETQALAQRNNALQKERDGLKRELAETTRQRDKLAADFAYVTGQLDRTSLDREEVRKKALALEKENRELIELARAREEQAKQAKEQVEQVKQATSTYETLLEKMKTEISRGQVTISELEGKLSVNLVDSILFESGKAEVKKGGEEILAKVVSTLTEVQDKAIRIEGHTDNVAIAGALAKKYPTNWELSAARAINVARFLQQEGVPADRLSAVAFGEWKPVGDNDTPEGRAQNRRIEITLVDTDQP